MTTPLEDLLVRSGIEPTAQALAARLLELQHAERRLAELEAAFRPILTTFDRDVEGTDAPWWCVVSVGKQVVKGPFFSREAAESWIVANRHSCPDGSHAYCFSGGQNEQWCAMLRYAWGRTSAPTGGPPQWMAR